MLLSLLLLLSLCTIALVLVALSCVTKFRFWGIYPFSQILSPEIRAAFFAPRTCTAGVDGVSVTRFHASVCYEYLCLTLRLRMVKMNLIINNTKEEAVDNLCFNEE